MQLTDNGPFSLEDRSFAVRVWEDKENAKEAPLVIVEPENRGYSTISTRDELAKEIASTLKTTPDKLTWYEMSPDGEMKQIDFKPYKVEQRPYAGDQTRDDYEAAEKKGELKPNVFTAYTQGEKSVTPESKKEIQEKLADPLESFEQKQNREFKDMSFSQPRTR